MRKSIFILLVLPVICKAYTSVTVSSTAPANLEKQFIADTTNQYTATLTANPYVPNTYTLKLTGVNPNFDRPITKIDLLNALVTVDSYTYVYGWVDGMQYERWHDLGMTDAYIINCSSSTFFKHVQTTTDTWDINTCIDALSNIRFDIYQQQNSSPTVVPGF